MKEKMQALWEYLFEVLYCEETGLIYEHRVNYEKDGNTAGLPTPETIQLQIPNPTAWGTGMEDCATTAGMMLQTVLNRYAVTGDQTMKAYAQKIVKGIVSCATVSGKRGFLARSVSPVDKKSFYFNTSRDQYTYVIYGLVKYMYSELSDEREKAWAKDTLVSFAELVEKEATKENNYELLRADNKAGIVCRMWNVHPHEALRLPMVYLAAWVASGEERWLNHFRFWREKGLARSEEYVSTDEMFAFSQMQQSIRLLYDFDPDQEYKERYLALMRLVAKHASRFFVKNLKNMQVNFLGKAWHEYELRCEWGVDVLNGYLYANPQDTLYKAVFPLLEIGDCISAQALCPNAKINKRQEKQFCQAIDLIDVKTHAGRTPTRLCAGYWAYFYEKGIALGENRK